MGVQGNWSNKELSTLYDIGLRILEFANLATGGRGEEWMRDFLVGVMFAHGNLFGRCYELGGTVHLADNWLIDLDGPGYLVTHELAHYIDDITGPDGPASCDLVWQRDGRCMVEFVGETPVGLRWTTDPEGIPVQSEWEIRGGYGNGSTADYFAEAFAWTIYNQTNVPNESISLWIKSVMYLQVNN